MEMSMLGDAVDADEALRIGLVNKVAADDSLAEESQALAEHLATLPTAALGRMKSTIHASFEADLETALEREAEGQTFCGYTRDHEEGVAAFFEKRDAKFTGR
jgi:2-(1,2-epoxy-1,2-dihydrophenyl)acetyl-CoA isomerase